jgi:hypothetical protein
MSLYIKHNIESVFVKFVSAVIVGFYLLLLILFYTIKY